MFVCLFQLLRVRWLAGKGGCLVARLIRVVCLIGGLVLLEGF